MSQELKSILRFEQYLVDKIDFRLNHNFSNKSSNIDIDLNVTKKVIYDEASKKGIVKLFTKVFNNPIENNYPFSLDMELTGFFEIDGEETKVKCEQLLNVNAVAILFPYVRALISTYTANANVRPLILPPININRLVTSEE